MIHAIIKFLNSILLKNSQIRCLCDCLTVIYKVSFTVALVQLYNCKTHVVHTDESARPRTLPMKAAFSPASMHCKTFNFISKLTLFLLVFAPLHFLSLIMHLNLILAGMESWETWNLGEIKFLVVRMVHYLYEKNTNEFT